ncbi:MAG TPA: MBL fold metallo-hydrolase [Bryobacteraceae bacterium]|nr:MBL fold metallo-hydrolase [Bryobacteraceae bacterium]
MRLSPHCYAVTGLAYSPPWCVNAGFIVGDVETLVIDTGGNALAGQTVHGYALAARPENRLRVLNTEKHFDHIGGNTFFRVRGIDIWGHHALARTPAEFAAEISEFNNGIPNAQRRAAGEAAAFFHGTQLTNPNRAIEHEIRLELGNCAVEILLTPGHTDTNISAWAPDDGVLFTGDCLIAEYIPNLDAGGPADWEIWLASIDRLEALRPETLVMGHGPIAGGSEVRKVIERVRGVLREAIRLGHSPTA